MEATHRLVSAQRLRSSSGEDHLSAIGRGQRGVVPQKARRDSITYGTDQVL